LGLFHPSAKADGKAMQGKARKLLLSAKANGRDAAALHNNLAAVTPQTFFFCRGLGAW